MYALSKMVFPTSVLCVLEPVTTRLKDLIHYYLWGKWDRVTTVSQTRENGGLNVLDIDKYIQSLKAVWAERIQFHECILRIVL